MSGVGEGTDDPSMPPIEWDDELSSTRPEPPAKPNGKQRPRLAAIDGNNALAPDADNEPRPAEFGDDALADEWVKQHGDNWRYVAKWATWFEWQGGYWKRCETAKYFDLARIITREALMWPGEMSAALKRKVNSASTAAAMLHFVKSHPKIAATIEQWDADPMMLATPDGVVDLTLGKLIEASRDQYCTRSTAVGPQPGEPKVWLEALRKWMGNDESLIHYIKLFCGYCLTGQTTEKMFLFVHGPADGGKSKFVEAIQGLMGSYAQSASMETFAETKHERHTTELAELAGARFVAAPETEEGTRWNQSRINALTGKDRIRARFMRQDNFEYLPQFKLLIFGNHMPHLKNVDSAIRRRLHILPFPHSIAREEQDPNLADKLAAEYGQILQWMIEGCLEWQQAGQLPFPEPMEAATETYFDLEDTFGQWVQDRLERSQHAFLSNADIGKDYREYCEQTGDSALGIKRFGQKLEQNGFQRGKSADGSQRGWKDVKLRPK